MSCPLQAKRPSPAMHPPSLSPDTHTHAHSFRYRKGNWGNPLLPHWWRRARQGNCKPTNCMTLFLAPSGTTNQGELVNDTATGTIPQEGGVFVLSRLGSYPISRFIVWFAYVCSHFHKESGKAQSDPAVQKLQHPEAPARTMSPSVEE